MKPFRNVIFLTTVASLTLFPGCASEKNNIPSAEPIRTTPDSIAFEWQDPYRKALEDFKSSADFQSGGNSGSAFDLLDINGDSTPELIISVGTGSKDLCRIYTCQNGSVQSLGEVCKGGKLEWIPSIDAFHDEYVGDSIVLGSYYTFLDGCYKETVAYCRSTKFDASTGTMKPTINGIEYLLPDYEEELKPYTSAESVIRGRKYGFGEKSIDFALKCSESWSVALNTGEKSLYRKQLTEVLEQSDDAYFELCDISGDHIPELIVSYGEAENARWQVYFIDNGALSTFSGNSNNGEVWFGISDEVLYYPQGEKKWISTAANGESAEKAVDPEKVADYVVLGRQHKLTTENIDKALN